MRSARIGGGYFIEDDGPGLDPDEVARLFSIAGRWRRPRCCACRRAARSATACGSRPARCWRRTASSPSSPVACGWSSGRSATATTIVVKRTACDRQIGTRIEISFGPALPEDPNALYWAQRRDQPGARAAVPTPGSRRPTGTTPRNSMSFCRPARRAACAGAGREPRRLRWRAGGRDRRRRRSWPHGRARKSTRDQAARLLKRPARSPSRSTRSGSARSGRTAFHGYALRHRPWRGEVRLKSRSGRDPVRGRGVGEGRATARTATSSSASTARRSPPSVRCSATRATSTCSAAALRHTVAKSRREGRTSRSGSTS